MFFVSGENQLFPIPEAYLIFNGFTLNGGAKCRKKSKATFIDRNHTFIDRNHTFIDRTYTFIDRTYTFINRTHTFITGFLKTNQESSDCSSS